MRYKPVVLQELARHGLRPGPDTQPARLREAVLDLYKYEIKVLKHRLLAGSIARRSYAGEVEMLRQRYPLLGLPLELWIDAD